MNTMKAFVTAATLSLLSSASVMNIVYAAENAPQTRFTLYHEADLQSRDGQADANDINPSARSADNGISVYDAEINLLEDYDHDGHYSQFEVIYDADDLSGRGLYAYTVVSLIDDRGHVQTLFTSPTFYIYGDTNGDAQRHMITLLDDYQPGDFRLRIELYGTCCSDRLDVLTTSAQEPIPLEGQYYDTTTYTNESYVETHYQDDADYESDGEGGSWGLGGMGALGLLYFLRRQRLEALLNHDDEDE